MFIFLYFIYFAVFLLESSHGSFFEEKSLLGLSHGSFYECLTFNNENRPNLRNLNGSQSIFIFQPSRPDHLPRISSLVFLESLTPRKVDVNVI